MPCEERMRELGCFGLEKSWLHGNLTAVPQNPQLIIKRIEQGSS